MVVELQQSCLMLIPALVNRDVRFGYPDREPAGWYEYTGSSDTSI